VYLWVDIQLLRDVISVLVWCVQCRGWYRVTPNYFTADQQTNNINKVLYMQPQVQTACTTDYNLEQILLYH
jgi:hypothetical protein